LGSCSSLIKKRASFDQTDEAIIVQLAQFAASAIERAQSAEELRSQAEFTTRILASSSDCIKVLDLDAKLQFMSAGGQVVMEVDDFEAIRGCSWPEFWSGEGRVAAEAAVAAAKAGREGRFQGLTPTAKGTPKWWDVVVTPVNGADGRPERLLSVSRDITEPQGGLKRRCKSAGERSRLPSRRVEGILWTNNARGEMEGEQPGWAALTRAVLRRVPGLRVV
jgi:PAS domain-containing protein